MFVGSHDMRDLHLNVVDGAREVIKRRAVGAHDHEVADLVCRELDVSFNQVVQDEFPTKRYLEANCEGIAGRLMAGDGVGALELAAKTVGPLFAVGRGLVGGPLRVGAVVAIDLSRGNQPQGGAARRFESLRLKIRAVRPALLWSLVPVDADPAKAFENALDGIVDVPFPVSIIDTQNELPAMMPSQQPVKQGRPHPADVQKPGRARGKARTYRHRTQAPVR